MDKLFFVSSHVVYSQTGDIAGPAHSLTTYLESRNIDYVFLKHPIVSGFVTEVDYFKNGTNTIYKTNRFWNNTPLRFLAEGILTLVQVVKIKSDKKIYIGIDPLNGFWGVLFKKIGLIKKFIYFSVDYSNKRFSSTIINNIYHFFDFLSVKSADCLWSVSERIRQVRQKMGVSSKKNLLVPNAPFIKDIPKKRFKQDSDLIIVANLSQGIDINTLLISLKELKDKNLEFTLKIIGAGRGLEQLQDQLKTLGLDKQVVIKGRMSHKEIYKEMKKSQVGIALYTRNEEWTYYCDPMKVRDYLACGLPVIMTDVPGLANDITKYHLGRVINKIDAKELEKVIMLLFKSKTKYAAMHKNALRYAQRYDLKTIYFNIFKHLELLESKN
ncbi:MAG: glycosyltransferase [Candidatus Woesebacteria bacterium]|nr:glycosyltransferase [Candidatus Woesebacteria bacterium]